MTVGIVVVSHSRALARAACHLAAEMVPDGDLRVEVAAGLDEPGSDDGALGTDADAVRRAIERADGGAGVLVICDLGSAVLSAEMAVELLESPVHSGVVVSPAPLVEGLVAACVTAAGGATLAEVAAEAAASLAAKSAQLADPDASEPLAAADVPTLVPAVTATFVVTNVHGLHARPAARLVSTARQFDAEVRLHKQGAPAGSASATSLSAVTLLGAEHDDVIELSAAGAQAAQARDAIVALAARAFDEGVAPGLDPVPVPVSEAPSIPTPDKSAGGFPVAAAPGLALGPAFQLMNRRLTLPEQEPGSAEEQLARLDEAVKATRGDLDSVRRRVSGTVGGGGEAAIFDAHALLLDDPALLDDTRQRVAAGTGVARAWQQAAAAVADAFARLPSSYQRERAADVRSVGEQVLRHLLGASTTGADADGIVVAEDLTPAQVADFDRDRVRAIVLAR
ncbi:MAG: dihydroxyacetone kinase phosphoryl donor subunit DhaM, partial [Mycobacteriaceae bacterium]